MLTLGLITDIHHGAQNGTKVGAAALPLLADFCTWANALSLDMVVEMGDRINNVDVDVDSRLTRDVAAAMSRLRAPRAHILGNHDNHAVSRPLAEELMQVGFSSWSRDVNGYHLAFWNAETSLHGATRYVATEADLAWLRADLAATELPTIVFTHLPLDDGSMLGNFYYERYYPGLAHYENGAAARDILERSGKVILCLCGHTHWNARNTIDGIHYVTIHSLTESFTTFPHPCGAYGLVQVGEQITIEVFGRDPAYYRLPIRARGAHWASQNRDFAPKAATLPPAFIQRITKLDGPAAAAPYVKGS